MEERELAFPPALAELNVALGPGKENLLEQSCPVEFSAIMEIFHYLHCPVG